MGNLFSHVKDRGLRSSAATLHARGIMYCPRFSQYQLLNGDPSLSSHGLRQGGKPDHRAMSLAIRADL
jgi:hypothetical protein